MPKSPNQKLKLLYLVDILRDESDEEHPLSTADLIERLGRRDITAERKSIYDDMEALTAYGLDVVTVKGRSNAYFLGERDFQLAEVKLLVDAVQSAKFLTAGKSRELIRKICRLAGRHQGGLLQRQVQVQGRAKTFNERTYYNVDALHTAMAEDRKIQYYYSEWAVDPSAPKAFSRKLRRGGSAYRVSPWTLVWDDEFYYLLAYDEKAGIIKHYRVDKMEKISILPQKREGRQIFEQLDMAGFSKRMFGMYGGTQEDVRMRMHDSLIGVVLDRFGTDVIIHKSGPQHFTFTAKVVVSPQFFSWLFGFGTGAQVLAPQSVVQQAQQKAKELQDLYNPRE